jgi:hypothetical protein
MQEAHGKEVIIRKGIEITKEYTFTYLEDLGLILVWKKTTPDLDGDSLMDAGPYYILRQQTTKSGTKYWKCNCPGYGSILGAKTRRREQFNIKDIKCRHVEFAEANFKFNKVMKPKDFEAQINDEYVRKYITDNNITADNGK